ncbi:PREDICTED: coiled-coil domain-containing protein 158 isoform X2 [Cyprinodon variegatus]|uniref:Coiled-coil domain containing 158 n=1 Tax=Cyprinodon variegatus TaxID=28743 RepID=A0A3Q2GKX6_CYPVA|nr:PREDICTED: coiled-coil domain-containing protein 158 isoform X2 [Cyprinodon variegatus]
MEKKLHSLEKIEDVKRSAYQKVQQARDDASALHREVELPENTKGNVEQFEHYWSWNKTMKHQEAPESANHVPVCKNVNEDTDKQGRSGTEQQRNKEYGLDKQERMEDVITSLGQEMAMLTDKLTSSKHSGVNLCAKLDLLRNLAESQTLLDQYRISELESTISSYINKVEYLEKRILEIQNQLFSTQKDRDQSLQRTKELESQLQQLQCLCEKQKLELSEGTEVLRRQLGLARMQLCKAAEDKSCLQALTEQRSKECQDLQTEQEALRLKLTDRDNVMDILRLQIENSSKTITNLQQENTFLINQHKQELQQLKAELDRHTSDLACVEREKQQLQASLSEQNRRIEEETLEKRKVLTQLELQSFQLFSLTEEHKELQRLHSCRADEHEGVVLKLQSQLSSAQDELEKVRRSLRTLRATDEHGLQAALDMQKEITAKRGEVDSLQSRIQHLEEQVEKLQQEKRRQNLETHRQLQELTFVREEKRQISSELKALRLKDHQLMERITELEAILHKMWKSLANCQDILQLKEQEYFRLKLQHTLNLKELPCQNLCAAPSVSPPDLNSRAPSTPAAPPSSQHPCTSQMKDGSACELRSIIQEMQAAISDNHRPHTSKNAVSSSFHRRRSAPERQHTATFAENEEGLKACSRPRRKTFGSEPCFLKTAELIEPTVNNRDGPFTSSPVSPAKHSQFPQILPLGRRSPVYTLLTSNPNR